MQCYFLGSREEIFSLFFHLPVEVRKVSGGLKCLWSSVILDKLFVFAVQLSIIRILGPLRLHIAALTARPQFCVKKVPLQRYYLSVLLYCISKYRLRLSPVVFPCISREILPFPYQLMYWNLCLFSMLRSFLRNCFLFLLIRHLCRIGL